MTSLPPAQFRAHAAILPAGAPAGKPAGAAAAGIHGIPAAGPARPGVAGHQPL